MRNLIVLCKSLAILIIGMGLASAHFLQFHFGLEPVTSHM